MSEKKITLKDLAISQPNYPKLSESILFYVDLANKIFENIEKTEFGSKMPEGLRKKISLTLADYMQDIVADAGLWRSFVTANRQLYGFTLPFYPISDSYIDFELNEEDVRFLVWYVVAMLWEDERFVSPNDDRLLTLVSHAFHVMEENYEEAPVSEHFQMAQGLEFKDPGDREKIYSLGNWLFLHSYLLTPAFAYSLQEIADEIGMNDPDFNAKLNKRLEEAMINETCGPLALFTPEWVYLMLEGKLHEANENEASQPHKYYEAFTRFTQGRDIMYFDSYEKLNRFFIEALGWSSDEEHLSHVKGQHDYTLMVDKTKGMLMAVNVARCIASKNNPLYDKEFADKNAFSLLVVRGLCPGDLLRRIFKENWLPDAHFPGNEDYEFVNKYADFIARTFLQIYYRGD